MSIRSIDVVVTTVKGNKREFQELRTLTYPAGFTPTMGSFVQDVTSRLQGRPKVRRVNLPKLLEISASNWLVGGKGRGVYTGGVHDGASIFVEQSKNYVKLMALVSDGFCEDKMQSQLNNNYSTPLLVPWYCGSHEHGTAIRVDFHNEEQNTKPMQKQEPSEIKSSPLSSKPSPKPKTMRLKLVYRYYSEGPLLSGWIEVPSTSSINQLMFRIRRKLQAVSSHTPEQESPLVPPITRQHKRKFDAWHSPTLTRSQKQKRFSKGLNENLECVMYNQAVTPTKKRQRRQVLVSHDSTHTPHPSVKAENGSPILQVEKMHLFLQQLNLMKCFEEFASQKEEQSAVAEACFSLPYFGKPYA